MKLEDKVLEILRKSDGHMTAEEMYLHCANNGIKGSMASVYRVLKKLSEEGMIRRISLPGQSDLFDKTLYEHEHLICVRCGKVKDIKIEGFKDTLIQKVNDDIESYDLCIRYVCSECKNK